MDHKGGRATSVGGATGANRCTNSAVPGLSPGTPDQPRDTSHSTWSSRDEGIRCIGGARWARSNGGRRCSVAITVAYSCDSSSKSAKGIWNKSMGISDEQLSAGGVWQFH